MKGWVVRGYVHERELGHEGFGRTVMATQRDSGRRVVIKYLTPRRFASQDFLWGFRFKAEALKSVNVPQLVRVLDYVEEPGAGAALVMELVDGISLRQMIARHGAMAPEAALAVLKESLLGLASAHALGVVHGDYKPENVLVDGAGNGKLFNFGMVVKAGRRVPSASTALYRAPEQWEGSEPTKATDIYAAAAVFFECLTGKTPFSGSVGQQRKQHLFAALQVDDVQGPLRRLVARGMAKFPAARPAAATLLVELEETAAAAYGPQWEARGRNQLAERAAGGHQPVAGPSVASALPRAADPTPAVRLQPLPSTSASGGTGSKSAASWLARHKKAAAVGIAASIAIVVGIATTAIALSIGGLRTPGPAHSPTGSATPATVTVNANFQSVVSVVPPAAVSTCATPTTFTYSSDITASAAGVVSYRWVYSSGKPSALQTLAFEAAGTKHVAGGVRRVKTAGTGWAELQILKPAVTHSNKATYRLLCRKPGSQPGQVTATAAVTPTKQTVSCGSPPPAFTFTGTITATKAELVSYYWALSDGTASSPSTLTFGAPGTQAVQPFTVTAPGDSVTGAAELVVTSPVPAVSNTATYTLTCQASGGGGFPALAISTTALPGGTEGTAYSATVAATGGDGSYTWTASGLPNGLAIGAGTGTISGTPAGAGTFAVTVTATDAEHPVAQRATQTFRLAVSNSRYPTLAISTTTLPGGTVGTAYTATLAATGGHGSYTWSAAGLPAGLAIGASTGTISGTPTAGGTSNITVTVKDSETPAPETATTTFALTVKTAFPVLAISTATLPGGTTGTAYTATLTATGGNGSYTWTATGLPAGFAIGASTGTISGTPTAGGTSNITVTVKDTETPAPQTATAKLALTVTSSTALAITTAALPGGYVGGAYAATVTATGGNGSYTWTATGLPAGLAINAATGAISGTPAAGDNAASPYTVKVTVTDTETPTAQTATATFTIAISPVLAVSTTSLPGANVEAAYSATLAATGGNGSYTWAATNLPAGLAINAATGMISGTPAVGDDANSPYTVTVTVTDTETPTPQTATKALTLGVASQGG